MEEVVTFRAEARRKTIHYPWWWWEGDSITYCTAYTYLQQFKKGHKGRFRQEVFDAIHRHSCLQAKVVALSAQLKTTLRKARETAVVLNHSKIPRDGRRALLLYIGSLIWLEIAAKAIAG